MHDVVQAPDWDEEAIEEAEHQARMIEAYDPDASTDLRAMAAAARRTLPGQAARTGEPYDPMKLYARMAKFYRFSHSEMEQMHFATFFAYLREANEIVEDERKETERARQGTTTSPEQGMFAEPVEYTGETVRLP